MPRYHATPIMALMVPLLLVGSVSPVAGHPFAGSYQEPVAYVQTGDVEHGLATRRDHHGL